MKFIQWSSTEDHINANLEDNCELEVPCCSELELYKIFFRKSLLVFSENISLT